MGAGEDPDVGAVGRVAAVLLVVVGVELVAALGEGSSGREPLGTRPATTFAPRVGVGTGANGKNSHIAS